MPPFSNLSDKPSFNKSREQGVLISYLSTHLVYRSLWLKTTIIYHRKVVSVVYKS